MNLNEAILKLKEQGGSYAILGDSITDTWCGGNKSMGGASDADHGYPQILHKMMREKYNDSISFTNRGVGGNTTLQAMERVDAEITPYQYDIIGIALGTNDWNLQLPLDGFAEQYEALIQKLKRETDAALFMVSIGYFHDWLAEKNPIRETEYNKIIFALAEKYEIPLVDTRTAMLNYMEENNASFEDITYPDDPVHPNDAGHGIWAKACGELLGI